MPRFPGFLWGSGETQSVIADAERTMNWYLETAQSKNAKSPMALFPTPGYQVDYQLPDAVGRGSCNAGGRTFFVLGATLFEIEADGTFTARGTVAIDQYPARLFYNGQVGGQIGISSGGNFYTLILATNAFAQQLTGTCTMAAYAAGFFFAFSLTTGKVLLSALNDGTNWSGGAFMQRELLADPWQCIFTDANNLLWLIGTESFEVRYNTGVGTQPWAPLSGLEGLYGIVSPFAFTRTPFGNFWVSATQHGSGELVFSTGSVPQPVRSYAFSTAVSTYLADTGLAGTELLSYQEAGHSFVIVHVPAVPATWAWDATEENMAERGVWNPNLGRFDLWMPRVQQLAFGKQLVAGWTGSQICQMGVEFSTEFDGVTGIVRERTTPGFTSEHARQPIDQLELLMDVGVTPLQLGQGSNPTITLRQSVDGGRTYGNERSASVGRIGEYRRRVYWQQLGAPSDVVLRVRVSDPVPYRLIDCWVNNFEKGA